jgi:hypothetical protein
MWEAKTIENGKIFLPHPPLSPGGEGESVEMKIKFPPLQETVS